MPTDASPPLIGITVVSLAVNLPGPLAAGRLAALGAHVVKVEPPSGDPLAVVCSDWYDELVAGQTVRTLDLKAPADRERLDRLLAETDLLLTSSRPSALDRLGLSWPALHAAFTRLCQVAIVGHPAPLQERAGHDLTYQAQHGTLTPPRPPSVPIADMAGAERAVTEAVAVLLARERLGDPGYREVALSVVAQDLAAPLRRGLTSRTGALGGALPQYGLYRATDGFVAVAALEPHFWRRLIAELGVQGSRADLEEVFSTRSAQQWERWAAERDLPVAAVTAAD